MHYNKTLQTLKVGFVLNLSSLCTNVCFLLTLSYYRTTGTYLSLFFCLLIVPLFQEQLIYYLINSRATGDTVFLLLFLQGRDGVPGQPGIKGQQGRMVLILQFELHNNHQILLLQHADSGLNNLLDYHH